MPQTAPGSGGGSNAPRARLRFGGCHEAANQARSGVRRLRRPRPPRRVRIPEEGQDASLSRRPLPRARGSAHLIVGDTTPQHYAVVIRGPRLSIGSACPPVDMKLGSVNSAPYTSSLPPPEH